MPGNTMDNTHIDSNVLVSSTPTLITPADITITYIQLRDLITCPHERGVINYLQEQSIMQHDIHVAASDPVSIADLSFRPDHFAALALPDTDYTLLSAGNSNAELHISLHHRSMETIWELQTMLAADVEINSVVLTSAFPGSQEPRLILSSNDCMVRFYDVPIRTRPEALAECGILKLGYRVNQCSLSPDGRILLSVGDSDEINLHALSSGGPGAAITFEQMSTLHHLPRNYSPSVVNSHCTALFSSAFSSDGTKFAVSSEEGTVMVWDIRSTLPLKVIQTDKTRNPGASYWRRRWSSSARTLKFGGRAGKEVMVFNEHTSFMHVIDAQTFETEEILRVPCYSPNHAVSSSYSDVDLAGLCFDPSGEYLYAGSTKSILEWKLM